MTNSALLYYIKTGLTHAHPYNLTTDLLKYDQEDEADLLSFFTLFLQPLIFGSRASAA